MTWLLTLLWTEVVRFEKFIFTCSSCRRLRFHPKPPPPRLCTLDIVLNLLAALIPPMVGLCMGGLVPVPPAPTRVKPAWYWLTWPGPLLPRVVPEMGANKTWMFCHITASGWSESLGKENWYRLSHFIINFIFSFWRKKNIQPDKIHSLLKGRPWCD